MAYGEVAVAQYGGFWRRVGAFLIDAIILNIFASALQLVVFGLTGGAQAGYSRFNGETLLNDLHSPVDVFLMVMGLLDPYVYNTVLVSSEWQATVGKRALGMQVVTLEGSRLTAGHAFGRELAKIPSALILMLGFFMVGWTERKQGLHDKIAGTLVVMKDTVSKADVF